MRNIFYSLIILSLFSCSKDEPEKPNAAPEAFEVTANADGTNVTLTWTEAADPDGDPVTYAVVYGDTLVKGLIERTFTMKDLPYETQIVGVVIASDDRGGKVQAGFSIKTPEEPLAAGYVRIPDAAFEEYLVRKNIDDKVDGKLLKKSALSVKYMHDFGKNITDLTGIEAFENLEQIFLDNLGFKELDFSHNRNLKKISITNSSNLKVLNISGCAELEFLIAQGCGLEALDISNNKKLAYLVLSENLLKGIDISKQRDLNLLSVDNNRITSLDLSENLKIEYLYVEGNSMENLDLSKNPEIIELYCNNNKLKRLDLLPNTALTTLMGNGNPIEVINLPSQINKIDISNTALKNVDFSKLKDLEYLFITNLGLEIIDLSSNTKLAILEISMNKLSNIDLSKNVNITALFLRDNLLSALDLCNNSKLSTLHCERNKLITILLPKNVTPGKLWDKDADASYKTCD